ncbi:tRNA-modifying protein YgfZ [Pirellulimonas nuda]|uniref:tRNA-modifying protein YgfZ n=1 Tax=Pirellulimonas nuda TaxID=2528009 RepID=A0A518DIS8_9BACT|nr:glycine cleavage T C-terminal barrel domain-containing protein [Pirellulimonas nuda]QDU91378.1 tRNA-modifying protein YgfZ [Pirellulimonas nuda]
MTATERDIEALAAGDAFARLRGWSVVAIHGADRAKLIQNLTTNDVKRLAPGEACESMFTDVKGRVLAFGLIACSDGCLYVLLGSDRAAQLAEHLERYHIREDVSITAPGDLAAVAFQGPPGVGFPLEGLGPGWRVAIVGPAEEAVLYEQLAAAGGRPAAHDAWETLRIAGRFPRDGCDVDAATLPQELARDASAISFNKGCYLGQETVARIDALGHVNRLLVGLAFTGAAPAVGAELLEDGKPVGRVTSVAPAPLLGEALGLGYVRRHAAVAGRELATPAGTALVRG